MKSSKKVIIAFLAGVFLFAVVQCLALLKERNDILKDLAQTKEEVSALQQQKQNLLQDLEKRKISEAKLAQDKKRLLANLRAGQQRLLRLFYVFEQTQERFMEANSQNSMLKTENAAIKTDLANVTKERDEYIVKFSSVSELKKAIKELKKNKNLKAAVKTESAPQQGKVFSGNSGFIIKSGEPVTNETVKIEVTPIPPNQ